LGKKEKPIGFSV
jgi:hypothetical protein